MLAVTPGLPQAGILAHLVFVSCVHVFSLLLLLFSSNAFSANGHINGAILQGRNQFASLGYASGNYDLPMKMTCMATVVTCTQINNSRR